MSLQCFTAVNKLPSWQPLWWPFNVRTQPILEKNHITISRDRHEKIHLGKPLKLNMTENVPMDILWMTIEESTGWSWWRYHMIIALMPKSWQRSQRCGQKRTGMQFWVIIWLKGLVHPNLENCWKTTGSHCLPYSLFILLCMSMASVFQHSSKYLYLCSSLQPLESMYMESKFLFWGKQSLKVVHKWIKPRYWLVATCCIVLLFFLNSIVYTAKHVIQSMHGVKQKTSWWQDMGQLQTITLT